MGFKKNGTTNKTDDVKVEVLEDFGEVSNKNGWSLRVRYVKWNDNDPKYDVRAWKSDENGVEKCRKGLSLTGEEAEELYKILKKIATGK